MAIPLLSRRARDPVAEALSGERQDFIRDCADMGSERCDNYRLYGDYYDGRQRTRLVDRARLYLEQSGVKFSENIVETAIDKAARRFHVTGFQVDDDEPASDWLTQKRWGRQDELQGIVHTEVPKLGDGFVIVSWDEKRDRPRLTWNRPHLIKPCYDENGDMLHAVKKWSTSKRGPQNAAGVLIWRLNVYYPDRVEKWFSADRDGERWAPWRDDAAEAWPLPWTVSGALPGDGSDAEDPLGSPVVHFREKPKGQSFGRSRVRGMMSYQDELNKQVLDLFYVMDAQGWAWPWITGLTDADTVKLAVGDVLKIASSNARVGQLPAANPAPLLEAIDATLRRFSAKTDTPLFDLIKGTPPSGEALKTAVMGQTAYVKDAQSTHGHAWETVVSLAWRLSDLHGPDDVPAFDETADITTQWESTEPRSELLEAQTAMAYAELGVSNATLMRRFGFDPKDEAKLKAAEVPDAPPPPPAPGDL
jgi:hypothetical protein